MNTTAPEVLVFDVNETLLDMTPLKEKVNSLLHNSQGFHIWFGLMLQYSLVDTVVRKFHPFPDIGGATLDMAATALQTPVSEGEKKKVLSLITQLPPHPDVVAALESLKEAGFRLFTLTNSPRKTLEAQLDFAQLHPYFEQALSVDAVQLYKPAAETYRYAAEKAGTDVRKLMMIAAHGWDLAGATAAGLQTAFVARKGQALYGLSEKPTREGKDLLEISKQLTHLKPNNAS